MKVSEGWRLPLLSTAHAGCASRPSVSHGLQRASDDAWESRYKKKRPSEFLLKVSEGWRLPTLPLGIAVPSALTGLTSLFGMGRGGSPSLLPPFFILFRTYLFKIPAVGPGCHPVYGVRERKNFDLSCYVVNYQVHTLHN